MNSEVTYSLEKIGKICEEIGRQWEYHLVTRALLPVDTVTSTLDYSSPPFYRHHGADFRVIVKTPDSPLIRRALKGAPHWLNQNYIIRLYGLLDENMVITAGKEVGNEFTLILAG